MHYSDIFKDFPVIHYEFWPSKLAKLICCTILVQILSGLKSQKNTNLWKSQIFAFKGYEIKYFPYLTQCEIMYVAVKKFTCDYFFLEKSTGWNLTDQKSWLNEWFFCQQIRFFFKAFGFLNNSLLKFKINWCTYNHYSI